VHDVLAVISIGFGLGAGWIGWRRLRTPERTPERTREDARQDVAPR